MHIGWMISSPSMKMVCTRWGVRRGHSREKGRGGEERVMPPPGRPRGTGDKELGCSAFEELSKL